MALAVKRSRVMAASRAIRRWQMYTEATPNTAVSTMSSTLFGRCGSGW